jgi:archaellum component FlaC
MPVVEFPTRARKHGVQKERLDDMIETLNELYDNLERAYQIVHRLEEETNIIEKNYNQQFRTYVGSMEDHEQVEIQYLNYSTEAEIYEDSESNLRIRFRGDYDEAPETETPL